MLSITNISNTNRAEKVNFCAQTKPIKNVEKSIIKDSFDTISFKGRILTKEDKQQILSKARTTAAGWSFFADVLATAYFGLRSDKTVAEKYNLDPVQDKNFIKKIKSDQVIATVPSIVLPFAGGAIAYLYCKNQNPDDITVE